MDSTRSMPASRSFTTPTRNSIVPANAPSFAALTSVTPGIQVATLGITDMKSHSLAHGTLMTTMFSNVIEASMYTPLPIGSIEGHAGAGARPDLGRRRRPDRLCAAASNRDRASRLAPARDFCRDARRNHRAAVADGCDGRCRDRGCAGDVDIDH